MKRWKQRRNLGPRLGITAKAAEHQLFEPDRHGRPMLSKRRRRLQNLRIGLALPHLRKGKLACEQLVKCGSKTENIGSRRNLFQQAFFRRDMGLGTAHPIWARIGLPARNPEVTKDGAPFDYDHVGWLYVEMEQAAVVDMS